MDQSNRYANLDLNEDELIKGGRHILVAYKMKPKAGYGYLESAAHFAAESSTGTNVEVSTTDDFTKGVDALVYHIDEGQQQRVGIAQAIIHNPEVVILDEPTVGLDPAQLRDIRALVRELGNTRSVILSTHLLGEVENICDRVEIMHEGRLIYGDTSVRMKAFGDGNMKLEDIFIEITQTHAGQEDAP